MKARFLDAVREAVLVGDGAMGTQLMQRGLEAGACAELWNVERRRDILEVHTAYVEAGADLVLTNTFGASRWKLDGYGLGGRAAELNAAGVAIARKAAGERAFVLGDIGPTGRFMEPLGTDPRKAFVEIFGEQARALAEAGADGIILETFTDLNEAVAALEAAKATDLPVVASMTYNYFEDGPTVTLMGNQLTFCVDTLAAKGADVIGANCGQGPDTYLRIVKDLLEYHDVPVMVEPNAGLPQLVGGVTVFPMGPQEFAAHVKEILAAGARIVGGCCGTTPDHIRAIRRIVDETS